MVNFDAFGKNQIRNFRFRGNPSILEVSASFQSDRLSNKHVMLKFIFNPFETEELGHSESMEVVKKFSLIQVLTARSFR